MSYSKQRPESAGETKQLTNSELHWLFADPRCKTTLEALEELALPADLETLATAVASIESDADSPKKATEEAISVRLHHAHLPKMDRLGLIEYDAEQNRIEE